MKYLNYKIIAFFILILFSPIHVFGATVEVENKDTNIQQGDTVIFDVYLNSEDEINSVEGAILLEGDYTVKTITTAGSIFDLWPNKPSFQDDKISFVGGSVSSVFGNKLKLFSIVLKINSNTGVIFSSDQIDVFLNDGIGTKISVAPFEKKIILAESDGEDTDIFENIVLNDQDPPLSFEISIGRDRDTYEGKYFATFNTIDKDSGIERYEIIENGIKTPILTGTTYVLQDQSLKGTLTVRAIDKAGNVQSMEVKPKDIVSEDTSINWKSLGTALLILFGIFFLHKKIKNKNAFI